MSQTLGATRVPLEAECYIPVPKHKIVEVLAATVADGHDPARFRDFCKLVEGIYHFEFHEVSGELKQDFELFDATDGGRAAGLCSEEELREAESRFLRHFHTLMEKGNFRPLTQHDVDVAEAEEYLFNLPVRIDWKKLDSEMLSRFFAKHPEVHEGELPDFANQILIYRRGVDVEQTVGLLMLQKIDLLVSQLLLGIWSGLCRVGRWLSRLVGGKAEDEAGAESGDTFEPIEMPSSLQDTADAARPESAKNERYVERISLRNTGVSLLSLFRKTRIQEPTFRELIILFRFASPTEGEPADRTIHIKAFRDIPMADLEVVFPEKRISMKPLDLVTLTITGTAGVAVVVAKLAFAAVLSPVAALVAVASLLGYASKVALGFKASKDRYQHLVTNSLYHKNLDNDLGVIFYLMDSLEEQEFKEAVIGYFMLLREGEMTEEELDLHCEAFLKERFGVDVDFEVDDALHKLLRDELVICQGDRYQARPLEEALERLDSKWDNFFRYA